MSLCNRAASVVRLSVRLSVHPSVCKLLRKSLLLPDKWLDRHQTYTTWSPHGPASGMCSRSRSRSRETGISVMSRNVCYTVPSDVLSLHALTLWSTVTLSFQYKRQAARCNVYIMEWATRSLTVWFLSILANSPAVRERTLQLSPYKKLLIISDWLIDWLMAGLYDQETCRRWMWCRGMGGLTFQLTRVIWTSVKVQLTTCSTVTQPRLENVTCPNVVVNCATFRTCIWMINVSCFFLISSSQVSSNDIL